MHAFRKSKRDTEDQIAAGTHNLCAAGILSRRVHANKSAVNTRWERIPTAQKLIGFGITGQTDMLNS